MANPDLIKTYDAGADIPAYTLVKFGASDYQVVPAAAATDGLIGVASEVAAKSGGPCDVIHDDIANVKLGGTVTRGDYITSDANGKGVKCAPTTGTTAQFIGKAIVSGVSGDIIPVLIGFGQLTTP